MKSRIGFVYGLLITAAVCGLSQPAGAGVTFSGDWRYGSSAGGEAHTASTANDSGSSLRLTCFRDSGTCYYVLNAEGVLCKDKEIYHGMVNSNLGSYAVELHCKGNEMVMSNFDDIDRLVRNASRIGIVIPLKAGDFSVSRFSLAGSTHAVDSMLTTVRKAVKPRPAASTTDIRL